MKSIFFKAITIILFYTAFLNECAAQQPNIILILVDDIGYKSLRCDGGNLYTTPNIDTLAQKGMRFTECHASPVCSPSRFMLLTGKYNFRNYTEWSVMRQDQKTLGNMFKDAGYKTACFGKWQFDGGDASIRSFGFDDYALHDVFGDAQRKSRYKNPHIYTHGSFLPDSVIQNQYGPDITADSLYKFLERNTASPFFVYYPMILVHQPFEPTPNDSAFATWLNTNQPDTTFFYSMMNYMDKKVGELVAKLKQLGIDNNTLILFTGDNGTPETAAEYSNDDSVVLGGKHLTTEGGTKVPLLAYWPGKIAAGTVNNDLVNFTDFLPTVANAANIPLPTTFGSLDGVSFYPQLLSQPGTPRSWIFSHYEAHPNTNNLKRWAQTGTYKLYDTSAKKHQRFFYNIIKDSLEKNAIPSNQLTHDENIIKQQLLDVITNYIAQGTALLSPAAVSIVTDTSIYISDTILINGGSTVTSCGFAWGLNPGPTINSTHTTNNISIGAFSNNITGLLNNRTYYIRAYAVNAAGVVYGNEINFKTSLTAPVAVAATLIDSTGFVANWRKVTGVSSYKLDVSPSPTFSIVTPTKLVQGFTTGLPLPAGWVVSGNVIVNNNAYGKAAPSLEFIDSKAQVITKPLNGNATQLRFWLKGLSTDASSSFLIEGFNGSSWVIIQRLKNITLTGVTKTYNATSVNPLPGNITQFRFTYTKSAGTVVFDDVAIDYNDNKPSFVTGYNNLPVGDTSRLVTGLSPASNYYYRVRSSKNPTVSVNSNVINAFTCKAPVINNISITNISCHGNKTGAASINSSGILLSYSWTGPGNFISSDSNINNLAAGSYHVSVKSNGGCAVDTTINILQPDSLNVIVHADSILCGGDSSTITVNASGGTGSYHYSLSDGLNTIAPQTDNHFKVAAGSYTIIVEDSNHCIFTTSPITITAPGAISATLTADSIMCAGDSTVLTVNATGGTGAYRYILINGSYNSGPRSDNHFTIVAGNYMVVVKDANNCSFTKQISISDGVGSCKTSQLQMRKNDVSNASSKNNKKLEVKVYPNPSSNYFSVKINSSSKEKINILITDVFGKTLLQFNNVYSKNFSFGYNFKPGNYFMQVSQGLQSKTLKLIKIN